MKLIAASISIFLCFGRLGYGNSTPPDNPFSDPGQAMLIIQQKLSNFSLHPSMDSLVQIDYLVKRVPVNGVTNTGIQGRDVKLILMLQMIVAIDGVWQNKKIRISPYPQIPSDMASSITIVGEDPSAIKDPVVREKYIALIKAHQIEVDNYNLQTVLGEKRHAFSKMIPIFIKYNFNDTERDHWKGLVRQQLQNDAKSKDLLDLFLSEVSVK